MKKDNFLFFSFPEKIKDASAQKNVNAMNAWLQDTEMSIAFKTLLKIFNVQTAKIYDNSNTHWFLITEKDGIEVIIVVGFIESMCSRFFVMTRLKRKTFFLKKPAKETHGCGIAHDVISYWDDNDKEWKSEVSRDNLTAYQEQQIDRVLEFYGLGSVLENKN